MAELQYTTWQWRPLVVVSCKLSKQVVLLCLAVIESHCITFITKISWSPNIFLLQSSQASSVLKLVAMLRIINSVHRPVILISEGELNSSPDLSHNNCIDEGTLIMNVISPNFIRILDIHDFATRKQKYSIV